MTSTRKWKIEFGGRSKQELLLLLSEKKICMNAYATQLFMDQEFLTSSSSRIAEVVEKSVIELGFETGALYRDIIIAAERLGLKMCPLELAPQFRVQYLNQQEGPYLTIASVKTKDDDSYPNGFYLSNYGGFYWLRGYRSTSDWLWEPDQKFAFVESYA